MLVGLFEPMAAPWSLDGSRTTSRSRVLPPDWDRMAGFLSDAMDRFPSLHDAGVRQFFCGPESFTSDNGPLLGEVPELEGSSPRAGSTRSASCCRGGAGTMIGAVDRRRRAAGRRHGDLAVDRTDAVQDHAGVPRAEDGRAPRRAVRRRGVPDLAAVERARGSAGRRSTTGSPPPARDFVVLTGWEYPEWFACRRRLARAPAGVAARPVVRRVRRRAPGGPRGGRDDGHVADGEVHGPGSGRADAAQPGLRERVDVPVGQDRLHAVVHTERRDLAGPHGDPPRRGPVPRDRGGRDPPADARRGSRATAPTGEFVSSPTSRRARRC